MYLTSRGPWEEHWPGRIREWDKIKSWSNGFGILSTKAFSLFVFNVILLFSPLYRIEGHGNTGHPKRRTNLRVRISDSISYAHEERLLGLIVIIINFYVIRRSHRTKVARGSVGEKPLHSLFGSFSKKLPQKSLSSR